MIAAALASFLLLAADLPAPKPGAVAVFATGVREKPSRAIEGYLADRIRANWGIAATKRGRSRAAGVRAFQVELRWAERDRFELVVAEGASTLARRDIACGDVHEAEASAWLLVKYAVARALREAPPLPVAAVDA